MPEADSSNQRLGYTIDLLKLEVSLFWQRSLFFWGFSAASLVAYGVLSDKGHKGLTVAVSCFGLICSIAWSLVNRGSKYWNENWLTKAQALEREAFGTDLFSREEKPREPSSWLSGQPIAVTKVTIALSDFAILLWLVLGYTAVLAAGWSWRVLLLLFVTIAWAAAMIAKARRPTSKFDSKN
jgi:hypothetical protein